MKLSLLCWLNVISLMYGLGHGRPQENGDGSCLTADGLPGTCQSSSTCKATPDQASEETTDSPPSLMDQNCGFTADSPKVCCPGGNSTSRIFGAQQPTGDRADEGDDQENEIPTRQGSFRFSLPRNCGMPRDVQRMNRIAGGVQAPKGAWPWMARIGFYKNKEIVYLCGGVLISSQYVLTAAHCVHNRKDLIFVRLGDHGASDLEPHDYYIENVKVHENYSADSRGPANDIAIIRISGYVIYTSDIQPICLPVDLRVRNLDLTSTSPYLAGWGSLSYYEPPTDVLMEVQIPVVSQKKCLSAYKDFKHLRIDDSVLCAGLDAGGKDACRGDSGSPLMSLIGRRYYAMGLVSFGVRCAQPGFPGVYSRIPHHMNWILNNIP